MKSVMYAVNGDQTVAKPYGASEVYIVNGDTSFPKPAGVSEVYLVNGDTSIPRPAGVSEVYADEGDLTIAKPDGVSVVSITNYSSEPPEPPVPPIPRPTQYETLRFRFSDTSYRPTVGSSGCTATKGYWYPYDASAGIWDWSYGEYDNSWYEAFKNGFKDSVIGAGNTVELLSSSERIDAVNMGRAFSGCKNLISVGQLDASSVTNMSEMFAECSGLTSIDQIVTGSVTNTSSMFAYCSSLASVPLFDTSTVKNMDGMFGDCTSLVSIPLFGTSSATTMNYMFAGCYKVESGALALYQQASSQATPPNRHNSTFTNCGRDTTTGTAELAQIPTSWGGKMS